MAYEKNENRFKKEGEISLFYNDEMIAVQKFESPFFRKRIIEKWEKRYQFKTLKGTIYFQIKYYKNNF